MLTAVRFVARTLRAVKFLVTDGRIPWPLRWLVVIGALPIPGPVDEGILLIVAVPLIVFYRPVMKEAWEHAERSGG